MTPVFDNPIRFGVRFARRVCELVAGLAMVGCVVLVLVCAAGQAQAQTPSCKNVERPKVGLDFVPKSPMLDHTRSVRWLNRHGEGGQGWFVTGLTKYQMHATFDMRIEPVAVSANYYCLVPVRVTPHVIVDTHLVYISSELAKGSCEYNQVYEHEGRHVIVNQQMEANIQKALPQFIDTIVQNFSAMAPVPVNRVQLRSQQLLGYYAREFRAVLAKLDRKRAADQRKIDTRAEYERLSLSCGPNSAFQTILPAAMAHR
jgi:hypothetical protein